jgi:F-type H+-transporting ATPase subunit b
MKIDWFTVIAQIINFLILVWLLKRFLYKPILNAIDEREKKIASELEDAKQKEEKAEKEKAEFKQKNNSFNSERKKLMDKAVEEANEKSQELLEDARNEAEALRSKLEKISKEAQENLNHNIAQKTQQEVFAITRKTLADLASLDLEEQAVHLFIKRLNELKKEEKNHFVEKFKSGSNQILVQSAFDLSEKQQTEIKNSVAKIIKNETQFQFKTIPELIGGIELISNGFKMSWSISEYLNSLQKSISEMMKGKPNEETEKKVKPKTKGKSKKKENANN